MNTNHKALLAVQGGIVSNQYEAYKTVKVLQGAMQVTQVSTQMMQVKDAEIKHHARMQQKQLVDYSEELTARQIELRQSLDRLRNTTDRG